MAGQILVLNAGSSSLKFGVYEAGAEPVLAIRGQIAGIGRDASFRAADATGLTLAEETGRAVPGHGAALGLLMDWLGSRPLAGAGHRVVHGGIDFVEPCRLTQAIADRLAALEPLAPHHQPHNVAAIRWLTRERPRLAQIACFDTAFHAAQSGPARRLGLPLAYEAKGLRRYGFHGLSYEFVLGRLAELCGGQAPERVIVAHLGNGASLCAARDGKSIATTMGFSTLDGLVMATRSGSVDPGAILHLLRAEGMDAEEIEDLLYNRSGLLGLSGLSGDMRVLLASDRPAAAAAVEQYCYAIQRNLGSLAAVLEGLDALVFTGGVGENSSVIRERVCARLGWLGISLDPTANDANATRIGAPGSPATAWVIPTDEERVIARHAQRLLHL